jgi:hypothetical protein
VSILNDPAKVCFWTTKGNILDFKRACLNKSTDMSTVLRQAMTEFVEHDQRTHPHPGMNQQSTDQEE